MAAPTQPQLREPQRLIDHLTDWLGDWTATGRGVTVVGSAKRNLAGWDGAVHEIIGVATPERAVLSVPPHHEHAVRSLVCGHDLDTDIAALSAGLSSALGRPGRFGRGLFRWSTAPTTTADVGEWVPTSDQRVPEWLKPFNGDLLIAWDDDGHYGAGVGRKIHDRFGHELSVGTEESLRGRGLGRLLVATVARRVLDDGAIPTYLHAPDNYASAKVADAAGFPDVGWRVLGFWGA